MGMYIGKLAGKSEGLLMVVLVVKRLSKRGEGDLHGCGLVGDGLNPVPESVHLHFEENIEVVVTYSIADSSTNGRMRERNIIE